MTVSNFRMSPSPGLTEVEVSAFLDQLGLGTRYRKQVERYYRDQRSFFRQVKIMNPRISIKVSKKRLQASVEREDSSDFAKPWHKLCLLLLIENSNVIQAGFDDANFLLSKQ